MQKIQLISEKFCGFLFVNSTTVKYSSRVNAVINCYRDNIVRLSFTRTKTGTTFTVSLQDPDYTKVLIRRIEDENDLFQIINKLELYSITDMSFKSVTDPILIRFFENLGFKKSALTIKSEKQS